MSWLIPTLLSPLFGTVVNFVDKYVVEKQIKDYRGMPILVGINGLLVGILFCFLSGMHLLPLLDMALLITSGILISWSGVLYFKALSGEETSGIVILFQTFPMMVLILSYIFLGEKITLIQLVGFLIVLLSAIGVSNTKITSIKLTSAFWLILVVNFMWAVAAILVKFSTGQTTFSNVLTYESLGVGIGGLLLFIFSKSIRDSFFQNIKPVGKKVLVIMFLNEGFFVISRALTYFAYSIGPTALVSVMGSTNVFFGIFVGIMLTICWPKIIKEDISRDVLIKKIFYSIIMFLGIILVTI